MTTPGRPGNLTFQVVGVSAGQYGEDAAGNTVQGHTVHYRLGSGATSEIFVPDTTFPDSEAVEDLVKAAAQNLAKITRIQGTIEP